MKPLHLSPSKVSTYENCPRSYFYQYVLRIKSSEESVNLGFGSCIDETFEKFVLGMIKGVPINPVEAFDAGWSRYLRGNTVVFSSRFTADELRETGRFLAAQLPSAWDEAALMPVFDQEGKPILQRSLSVDVGNGVVLNTKLDILAMNFNGEVGVVDVKSPSSESSDRFTAVAEQLTAYQATVNAHAESYGIERVSFVAYWEFLKKKVPGAKSKKTTAGPTILRPKLVPARTDEEVNEYVQKLHAIADNIRAKRFYKSPRMAFNTPCALCSWASLCIDRDASCYVLPADLTTDQLVSARPTG
ncbi:MAG: hypothetical protein DDT34_00219 [Firmicutes bacterium]|nr:hypothetical protein [Bacillota bacterium]